MKLKFLTALLLLTCLQSFANPYIQDLPNPLDPEPSAPITVEAETAPEVRSTEKPEAELGSSLEPETQKPVVESTPTPKKSAPLVKVAPQAHPALPVAETKVKERPVVRSQAPVKIVAGSAIFVVSTYGPLPARVINLANGGRYFVEFTGAGYKGKRDHIEGRHVAQLSGCLKGYCVGDNIRNAKIVSIYPRMNSLIIQYVSGTNKGRFDRWKAAQF